MDHTKKKSIKKKLEELFRRRPTRKELVQRNILHADNQIDSEEPKQRKALLMRIMSKTGKEQMSDGAGKGQNVRQAQETKRSQTVSVLHSAPSNSLQAMTPLSVSSPAVIYDRTSYLQTEEGDFKPSSSPTSPRKLASLSPPTKSMSSSSHRKSMDSAYTVDLTTEPLGMERSRSASRIKSSSRSATSSQIEVVTPSKAPSPSWTNRAPSNTSVRTRYIDGSAKFSTLPAKSSPPSSPPLRSVSDEETTILREHSKQSSKLNILGTDMVFLKTPTLSSPLSDCPTPFFDQLMSQLDDSDM